MIFEDQVLGVLVLSKLGLHQFSDDDLRLLVIYASFAAQAMANADATERLRAVGHARAPAAQPARPAPDHRIDPVHAGPARRPRPDRRSPGRAGRLRQHLDRGLRPGRPDAPPADGARRQRRRVPQGVGARRDRHRDLGHRAQRAGPHHRPVRRPAGQALRVDGADPRRPDRRPAARPRGRHRRADARAHGRGQSRSPTRSSSSSSCSPPRSRSRSRTPRSIATSRSAPGPTG